MRTTLLLVLITSVLCSAAHTQDLTVAAASDLNYALKDLTARFEKKTGDKVTLSFGSSGNLYSQIQGGAPYDLFFSADIAYPQKLATAGLVESSSLRTYAVGHLVVGPNGRGWIRNAKDEFAARSFRAADRHCQSYMRLYGQAAMAALERFGLKDKVASKLVFGENISQAAQFVQSGNAQAGLIALSLAVFPR